MNESHGASVGPGPQDEMSAEIARLRKTCHVLKKRVMDTMAQTDSSFAVFEREAHMQRVLDERTVQYRRAAELAHEENRNRARVEALLNDSQRLARVGGWTFELASETLHCTEECLRIFRVTDPTTFGIDQIPQSFDEHCRHAVREALCNAIGAHEAFELEGRLNTDDAMPVWVRLQARVYTEDGRITRILGLVSDITERKLVEGRMADAQKMESVGQLAAGIAHEINTPTQFVSDNVRFLQDAFRGLSTLVAEAQAFCSGDGKEPDRLRDALERADVEFLAAEVPAAIAQSVEGLQRIANLVRAMKDYAHPGTDIRELADINRAIASTATVARNEWKYVAELTLDLQPDMPRVPCFLADVNQVVLNMIVNSAHAIEEKYTRDSGRKGTITICSKIDDATDEAVIVVRDDGAGIPERIRKRIFDPFFTTKAVGKGTGQGLAISHQAIVKKHGGRIMVDSQQGVGTAMEIRLPMHPKEAAVGT